MSILPSRPFTGDELRAFLSAHTDCECIYLFSEPSLLAVCAEFGFTHQVTGQVVSLDLSRTEDDLWADLNAKRRNGIRYARKSGVVVRLATPNDLDAATELWIKGFCAKHGMPTDNIRSSLRTNTDRGRVLLAKLGENGPMIAGVVWRDGWNDPYFQPGVYSIYSGNSSLLDYQTYKPNDLLVWEAALHAKTKGFSEFIIGPASVLFKRQFSRRRIFVEQWKRKPAA
jgi:Acetyltransferase (GNAT) domain